jgi:PIN domain nuclease of toxin-antitoxin system
MGFRKQPQLIANALYISIASVWEIAIKVSIGKLDFHGGSWNFLHEMSNNGVNLLGINSEYLEQLENLPFIHRDPFDRLLVATAISDGLVILSADENIHKYDVKTLW